MIPTYLAIRLKLDQFKGKYVCYSIECFPKRKKRNDVPMTLKIILGIFS